MIWKFKYRKQAFSFLKENDFVEIVKDKIINYIRGEKVDIKN